MNETHKESTKKTAPKASPARSRTKTVEIKIALPTLPDVPAYTKLRLQLDRVPKRTRTTVGVMTVLAIISLGSYFTLNGSFSTVPEDAQAVTGAPLLKKGTPNYKTLLPTGKTIESLGGWTRVSPPEKNPVFAYVDRLGNSQINVSQQPLPDDFKSDAEQKIEELALGFKASEKITMGNTIVHIGTSAKGPQSVIFSKNDLLILIKSTVHIDNNLWAEYISTLQ
jgi:hypothetical protein